MGGFCEADGCLLPEHAAGLCQGHFRRRSRGRPVSGRLREVLSPWGRVVEAALALADVSSEDDQAHRRAEDNLRTAITAYARKDPVPAPAEPVPEQV